MYGYANLRMPDLPVLLREFRRVHGHRPAAHPRTLVQPGAALHRCHPVYGGFTVTGGRVVVGFGTVGVGGG